MLPPAQLYLQHFLHSWSSMLWPILEWAITFTHSHPWLSSTTMCHKSLPKYSSFSTVQIGIKRKAERSVLHSNKRHLFGGSRDLPGWITTMHFSYNMTVVNNWFCRDSRNKQKSKKGHSSWKPHAIQSSSMCRIFLLKSGRCLKPPGKWMIVAYHLGGWKSKINLGVNMPYNSHFREIQDTPPSHKRDKVNLWVTTRFSKRL